MAGQDPDFHCKDLYEAISMSVFPTWKFSIQTMKESLADDFDFETPRCDQGLAREAYTDQIHWRTGAEPQC